MVVEDGFVHVVWRGPDGGDMGIFHRFFDGSAWSDPFLLTPSLHPVDQMAPVMAVNGKEDEADGDYDVLYRHFDGRDWLLAEEISEDVANEDQAAPALVIDSDKVHVIWRVDYQLQYRVKETGKWHDPVKMVELANIGWDAAPTLAASDGVVYLAYPSRDEASELCINLTVNDGGEWKPWGRINDLMIHYAPFPMLDAMKGVLVLVYQEMMTTDTVFQHFNGSGWSDSMFINDSSYGDQWLPSVRMADGIVHVTYSDGGIGKHRRGSIEEGPPLSDVEKRDGIWMGPEGTYLFWTISDDFGISTISLEVRYSADNETWSEWTEVMFEDGESGPEASGRYSFDPADGDGFYEFRTIGTDVWGNVEPFPPEAEARAVLDMTQPTGSIEIEGGKDYTSSTTVTLTLTFEDTISGVHKVLFSNEPLTGGEPWEDPVETRIWELEPGSGVRTVYYRVMDNVSVVSETYSADIVLDTDLPTGSMDVTVGDGRVRHVLVSFDLTYDDATSPVIGVRFSNDGIWDTEEWTTPHAMMTWTIPEGDGEKTVYYQFRDAADLVSQTYTMTVTLDTIAPYVESTDPADGDVNVVWTKEITIRFSEPMDTDSGEAAFCITYPKGDQTFQVDGSYNWSPDAKVLTFTPDSELGLRLDYTITIDEEAKDQAGNPLDSGIEHTFTSLDMPDNGGNGDGDGISGLVAALILVVIFLAAVIGFLVMRGRAGK
jgi:hypothetical protein